MSFVDNSGSTPALANRAMDRMDGKGALYIDATSNRDHEDALIPNGFSHHASSFRDVRMEQKHSGEPGHEPHMSGPPNDFYVSGGLSRLDYMSSDALIAERNGATLSQLFLSGENIPMIWPHQDRVINHGKTTTLHLMFTPDIQ